MPTTRTVTVRLEDGNTIAIPVDSSLPDDKLQGVVEGAIRARQRAKTNFERNLPENQPQTAGQVFQRQIEAARNGLPQAFTGIPGTATALMDAFKQIATGGGTGNAQSILRGALAPLTTVARGTGALIAPNSVQAPTDQEWENAATGAGANLAGATAGGIGGEVNAALTPERLMGTAATVRSMGRPSGIPISQAGAVRETANLATRPAAALMEKMAQLKAGPPAPSNPVPAQAPDFTGGTIPPSNPPATAVGQTSVTPITAPGSPIPAQAGGSTRPAFIPQNRPPIPEEPTTYGQFPGQKSQPINAAYKPPPDTGLPEMQPENSAPALNKWMNIPAKEVVTGANPGAQILEEKLLGPTKAITKVNVDNAFADANQQLDTLLKQATAAGVKLDAQTPVYDGLGSVIKGLRKPSDVAFERDVNGVLDSIETRYPNLHALSPDQAAALRRELGDAINWSGAAYDDPVNQAMLKAYRGINTTIKDSIPNAAKMLSRQQNLLVARKGLQVSMARDLVGTGTGETPNFK